MMHYIPRNPVEWDISTWAWVAFFVMFGGALNWLTKNHSGQPRQSNIVGLLGDLTLSLLIGIPTFMVLHGGTNLDTMVSLGISIAAGHGGTRFICKAEALANAYVCKMSGITQADLARFESPASYASNGVCLPIHQALTLLIEQGIPMRHVLWPANQWISMPTGGKIPVKAENLWSKANSDFARRRSDQTVFVVPAITMKLPNGEIINGWTPSVIDMSIPGWMPVEATDIEGSTVVEPAEPEAPNA